ncbi:MAG: UDP-N-acetylmuramoyl-tripeptide--D-alanyl-D-alanine ligase [Gemmatimonadota bacterium]
MSDSWTGATVADALGLPAPGSIGETEFPSISTDTRSLRPGALYVALAGERFDGHDHLANAVLAGATAAVVRTGTAPVPGLELFQVPDTLRALGDLARAWRMRMPGPVVAITGSNGKTSTKEMVAAVLRTAYRTHSTRANDNNLVGIPLTILAAPIDTEALVVEAGANQLGEIPRAREIIEPDVAIVTNVTEAHLEGFGSADGILREKLALTDEVPLAITGPEPRRLAIEARSRARRVISAGLRDADCVPEGVHMDATGRATISVDGLEIRLPVLGLHQAANAMLAWALVREAGLDRKAAAEALSSLSLPPGRGEILESHGLTIVNDSYNANPGSFRSAIATARLMRPNRKLVFVAGTMRELGEASAALHADIARELVALDPEILAVVGEFVPALQPYASRLDGRLLSAPDALSLGPILAERLSGDELVVLKASRGVALERIIPHLLARAHSPN